MITRTQESKGGNAKRIRETSTSQVLPTEKRISTRIRFKNKLKAASKQQRQKLQPSSLINEGDNVMKMEIKARSTIPQSLAHKIIFLNLLGLSPSSSLDAGVQGQIRDIRDQVTVLMKPEELLRTISQKRRKNTILNENDDADDEDEEDFEITYSRFLKTTSESGYDTCSSSPATIIESSSKKRKSYVVKGQSFKKLCEMNVLSTTTSSISSHDDPFDFGYLRKITRNLSLLGTELDFV